MKRRLLYASIAVVLAFITLVGPWPAIDQHYENSEFATDTFHNIETLAISESTGPLFANIAQVDITPPAGVPLGGYGAREPKANTGVMHPVFAKAISLRAGAHTVTVLNAEILLPTAGLIERVLEKTGLAREDIFFTATHTHSGPGGYADGLVNELALGDFHPQYFAELTDKLSQVVLASRKQFVPVSMRYQQLDIPAREEISFVKNTFSDGKPHDTLHLLTLVNRDSGNPVTALFTLSAHPTVLGRVNKKVSGDYPGIVQRALESRFGYPFVFAVGSVGAMLPGGTYDTGKPELERQVELLNRYADLLEQSLADIIDSASGLKWTESNVALSSYVIPVRLPLQDYRIGEYLRLSPFLVSQVFHDRDTFIHALRLGRLVLLEMPADFSGELSARLEQWAADKPFSPWVISFNGDYIGYLSPSERMHTPHYTTRQVAFYGPYSGDYFLELSQRICNKVTHSVSIQ